jgi:hypothetical protein
MAPPRLVGGATVACRVGEESLQPLDRRGTTWIRSWLTPSRFGSGPSDRDRMAVIALGFIKPGASDLDPADRAAYRFAAIQA